MGTQFPNIDRKPFPTNVLRNNFPPQEAHILQKVPGLRAISHTHRGVLPSALKRLDIRNSIVRGDASRCVFEQLNTCGAAILAAQGRLQACATSYLSVAAKCPPANTNEMISG